MTDWCVVPFSQDHAKDIIAGRMRARDQWIADVDMAKFLSACEHHGPGSTLLVDGKPIACAGVVIQEWNKGEAWALMSNDFYQHKVKAYRAIKMNLEWIITHYDLVRVQALIEPAYQQAIDFIEALGFSREGLLRNYGPKGDYLMYARIT